MRNAPHDVEPKPKGYPYGGLCAVQVSVVPGGVFRWGKGQLEVKATGGSSASTADGWQLLGALQYDDMGVSHVWLTWLIRADTLLPICVLRGCPCQQVPA